METLLFTGASASAVRSSVTVEEETLQASFLDNLCTEDSFE